VREGEKYMGKSKLYVGVASVALSAATLFAANSAAAQAAQPAPAAAPDNGATVETLIITGTSAARTALNTPMQATSIDSNALQRLQSNSAADVLATVPMLKAEGGGGEVANNIFVAGLPTGGQYQFTPLEFNGIPVIGTMGLNSSAPDVYMRPDLGVDRLEFVHGGVSNLFGGGSVGGLINYIDRTGSDDTQGQARLELGDMGRVKTDFAASGALNKDEGLYYAMSGWYRYDEGPIKSGMPSNGYQIRGNIKKVFDTGEITIYGQYIDDKDQFYGDYPLNGSNYNRPTGNDGKTVYTTETKALENMSFMTPNGEYTTTVGDGAMTRGGQVGVHFEKDLGDGWAVNGRGNVGKYYTTFSLFAGGDNVQNLPTTQSAFLSAYGYNPANYTAKFTYANNGAAVPASNLLWSDRVIDRYRPMETQDLELNLTKKLEVGDWVHNFTLGVFASHSKTGDKDIGYSYLGDFANAPQLINATVTNNATGATTIVSQNGLLHAGLQYTNNNAEAKRYAVYFADQASYGRWQFDLGGRLEKINGDIAREGSSPYVVNTTPGLSPLLSTVQWGNGQWLAGSVQTSAWALAGSVLYRLNDVSSVFVNASRGYFFPQMNSVQITAQSIQGYEPEIIKQVEGGYKYNAGRLSGSLSLFYSTLTNLQNVQYLNAATGGGVVELVNTEATRSYGASGTLRFRIIDGLTFDGNATYEHDRYTQYSPIAACLDCVGNTLVRQPDWMATAGFYYDKNGIDAAVFDTYTGRTFTSDLNNIEMPGFHVVRIDAGYTFHVRGDAVRAGFSVYNLFDTQAVTEGSPRLGTLQNAGQAYFVGRTVLPRRITVNVSYKF
jgi:outer membrane receptor protein involved in Fe transport